MKLCILIGALRGSGSVGVLSLYRFVSSLLLLYHERCSKTLYPSSPSSPAFPICTMAYRSYSAITHAQAQSTVTTRLISPAGAAPNQCFNCGLQPHRHTPPHLSSTKPGRPPCTEERCRIVTLTLEPRGMRRCSSVTWGASQTRQIAILSWYGIY